MRANLEHESPGRDKAVSFRARILNWIKRCRLSSELEADEARFLRARFGSLPRQAVMDAEWSIEAVAVMAWALRVARLRRYDRLTDPGGLLTALGFLDDAKTGRLMAEASLRSEEEIATIREQCFAIHWRLVEFGINRQKMDFRKFAKTALFGPLDIAKAKLEDNDLALNGLAIAKAPANLFRRCMSLALERHRAANWLCEGGLYSEVTTDT